MAGFSSVPIVLRRPHKNWTSIEAQRGAGSGAGRQIA
jgi:hypothetical protein